MPKILVPPTNLFCLLDPKPPVDPIFWAPLQVGVAMYVPGNGKWAGRLGPFAYWHMGTSHVQFFYSLDDWRGTNAGWGFWWEGPWFLNCEHRAEPPLPLSLLILNCDMLWMRKNPDDLILQSNITLSLKQMNTFLPMELSYFCLTF